MAQQVVHARVLFNSVAPNADSPSNDFYFEATGAGPSIDFDAIVNPTVVISSFYNLLATGATEPVCFWIGNDTDRTTNSTIIEYYDVTNHLDGSPAGSPIRQDTFTLGSSGGGQTLPPGCAICVGYRADYGGTAEFAPGQRPRARLRGRFYLGPLLSTSVQGSGGVLVAGIPISVGKAFSAMAATKNQGDTNQFNLVQWSRRGQHVHQVTNYFVDEAVSYQRRRADDTLNRVHQWLPVTG